MALLQVVSWILGLGSLICYILVIVKMFQNDKAGLAIACLLLLLLCGIGGLVAFIIGWMNADQWGIRNIMLVWTLCVVVGIVCNIALFATGGMRFPGGPAIPIH
jgi:uncharacterized membrane protein